MSLYKEIEKLKYDKRLTDWHLSRNKVTKEEWQKYLSSLPDSAENVDTFRLHEEAGDRSNGNGSMNGSHQ